MKQKKESKVVFRPIYEYMGYGYIGEYKVKSVAIEENESEDLIILNIRFSEIRNEGEKPEVVKYWNEEFKFNLKEEVGLLKSNFKRAICSKSHPKAFHTFRSRGIFTITSDFKGISWYNLYPLLEDTQN